MKFSRFYLLFYVIGWLFFTIPALAQQSKFDSLKKRLLSENARAQIETYLDISEQPIPRDTAILYLNKALENAKKIQFDSIYPIQFALAASYYVKGDLQNAKKEIRKGLKTYEFTKDPPSTLGHINMLLGVFNEALNKVDSAKYYYDKVLTNLKDRKTNRAKDILSTTYTNYANLYLKSGDYKKAIEIYLKADKLSKETGDIKNRIITLNNIAGCFKEINQYDKAIYYFNEALKLAKQTNDAQNIAGINIGLGQIYLQKNEFDKAQTSFLKAENILKNIGFKSLLSIAYQGLAEVYLHKKDYKKAKLYSDKALKNINEIKDDYSRVSILLTSGLLDKANKNYNKALKKIDDALSISQRNNYLDLEKKCLKEKIDILKLQKKEKLLPPLYEKYISLKDTILNKEKFKSINDIETKYQTEKKERKIAQQQNIIKAKELETQKARTRNLLLIIGLLSALLIAFFIWRRYRAEAKAKRIISGQKAVIEELQKELHHRIKNNLNIIDAFVDEIIDDYEDDHKLKRKLEELQNRIYSIKEVHTQLYQNADINNVAVKKYIDELANKIAATYKNKNVSIKQQIKDDLTLKGDKSFVVGLIVNEFLTNSYKYAFDKDGEIQVELSETDDNYVLKLSDNGKGLPKNFNIKSIGSYGLRIMLLLSKQLKGTFDLRSHNGVQLTIQFPKV